MSQMISEPDRGDQLSAPFQLLETMRVEGGEVSLLDRHLLRLASSAAHFGYPCDTGQIREAVLRRAVEISDAGTLVMRWLLHPDGSCDIQVKPYPLSMPATELQLAAVKVDSGDASLYHKTTRRHIYDEARAGLPAGRDALLVNERGELTEATIANIAVSRGGQWITPQVSCGLLPGTMRAELLEQGEVVEGVVHADELAAGEMIRYFNSVRGMVELPYRAPPAGDDA